MEYTREEIVRHELRKMDLEIMEENRKKRGESVVDHRYEKSNNETYPGELRAAENKSLVTLDRYPASLVRRYLKLHEIKYKSYKAGEFPPEARTYTIVDGNKRETDTMSCLETNIKKEDLLKLASWLAECEIE